MSPSPQQLLLRWQDMPQKKRMAFLNLAAIVLLFLGYQNVLRPQMQRLNTVRKEWRNLNTPPEQPHDAE